MCLMFFDTFVLDTGSNPRSVSKANASVFLTLFPEIDILVGQDSGLGATDAHQFERLAYGLAPDDV